MPATIRPFLMFEGKAWEAMQFYCSLFSGATIDDVTRYGAVMMPLDNYGFSKQFAWVSDRYGVSWQLNLP